METTPSEILEESKRLILRSWPMVAVYVAINAGLQTLADQPGWGGGGQLAASIAGVALGYALVTKMVEQRFQGGSLAGFWSYFGLSLISGIGLTLATLALVIPGIFLFVRWSPAYGFLCVEGEGVTQSLSSSYALTRDAFWSILIALVIPLAIGLAGIVAVVVWTAEGEPLPLWVSLAANGAASATGVLVTAIGLAVYSLLRRPHGELDAVFA